MLDVMAKERQVSMSRDHFRPIRGQHRVMRDVMDTRDRDTMGSVTSWRDKTGAPAWRLETTLQCHVSCPDTDTKQHAHIAYGTGNHKKTVKHKLNIYLFSIWRYFSSHLHRFHPGPKLWIVSCDNLCNVQPYYQIKQVLFLAPKGAQEIHVMLHVSLSMCPSFCIMLQSTSCACL